MTAISSTINNNSAPANIDKKQDSKSIIQKIALATLQELAASALCVMIAAPFVATPVGLATLAIAGIAIVAFNTLVRSAGGFFYQQYQRTKFPEYRVALTVCQYLAPLTFSALDNTTRDLLAHEAGHALTAKLLYKNANPTITIMPFKGGVTNFTPTGLTTLGKLLGPRGSNIVVTAAGAGASLLSSIGAIVASHYLKKSHPALSRYLFMAAIMSIVNHAIYALSALTSKSRDHGHDFVALQACGIHPVVSCAYVVALPIITKVALLTIDYLAIKFVTSPSIS